ncbi:MULTISPECIES: DUF6383 domain-containing protein [Parabacteroides]|jgi:hypothetical protein|uniref:DUF6383 domain-containing protein n=1 Tax=Parabacteroides TaxID=375288 RepID=UPI001F1C5436|nr:MULTISPECIES: DUF6383 domain-containing protein [Parabacteroides]
MNKKFSTLVAGLAMISAVASAQITKTDGYTMLKSSSSDYLAVYGAKSDSVVVKTFSNLATAPKASIDSAMWKVTEAGVDATGNKLYSFTNKKTGAVLSFAAKKDAKPNLAAGVDKWSVTADGKISAYYSADGSLGLVVSGGKLSLGIASAATAFTSEVNSALKARTLAASDLGDGFTVFSLNFGEAYQENIFEGKELVATQLTGADADYVQLQEVGADKIGEKDAYFGLDTTKYTIAGQKDVFGYKFAKDSTWLDNGYHTVLNGDFQKFKFIQDLSNDKVAVYVKNAPVYNTTTKKFEVALTGTAADVQVVYAQVTNSKVLTVSKLSGTPSTIEQGVAPSVKLGKGTPATLPTGDGVYFIKVKSGDEFKYVYATASGLELKKDAPNAYNPAGQFYVVAKGGKYQFVERNFNQGLTTAAAQIYKVTGKDAYRVDAVNSAASASLAAGEEFYFEYQKDIKAGGKEYNYMATKYLDKVAIDNFAYTLNLISGTEGVDDLYTIVDGVLKVKKTTAEDAAKFKVEVIKDKTGKVWTSNADEHKAGVGAIALGDTLATATYKLYKQYTKEYVVAKDNEFKLAKEDNTATPAVAGSEFTFKTAKGNGYLLSTGDKIVVLDVNTGKLISAAASAVNNNYFDLVVEPSPDYATLNAPSHMLVKSAEADGKALSMNPKSLFAEVKLAGQEEYIDSLFGLWIDTACVKDVTRPTYYITTGNGLDSAAIADGYRYFLVNPQDSVYSAVKGDDDKYTSKTNEGSAYWNATEGLVKAAFVKAIVYGEDSLAIVREKATAVDTLKTMSVNPAAMAFVTTANNTLKIENKTTKEIANEDDATKTDREDVTSYLKVINNVLVWTDNRDEAHEFVAEATTLHPTSNDNVEEGASAISVVANAGTVTIQGAAGKSVVISNILGKVVAETVLSSDNATIAVPAGIVAVAVEGEAAVKVVVK